MNTKRSRPGSIAGIAGGLSLALLATLAGAAEVEKTEPNRADMQQKLEAAQKRLDAAAREVADLSMSISGDVMPRVVHAHRMMASRAVLGINVGGRENESRQDGVVIQSVSPGGGAADAGLKAGDVLTEINGKALKQTGDESPRSLLLEGMRAVKSGDKVAVKYQRDGKVASATVTAQEPADRLFNLRVPGPPGAPMPPMPAFAFSRLDGVFGAAEFVKLTPKLGQYFGTEKGLLVVRAPRDSRLKLEEGDVIVDIDGRVPSSSSHAMQILSSYEPGEKLQLNVLRMKKKLTVDVTIPENARGSWERRLDPDEDVFIPASPVAAAVPAMSIAPVSVTRPMPAAGAEVHIITAEEPL
ncbi:putative metalloprotease with PDZ domain [Povalibacter uvarum]|uniref:Putative metalloprotease with PDZ domain n=1 Tax=Povalibacter uvarum TaxID=732238 RepID=A0A841HUR6_9GAMM|nr:PDZ domain-containing protein [Povalibacter uvarum]MBB6096563.1 putative metalloprotease with PDZ domain [Povalibacter uvarum]